MCAIVVFLLAAEFVLMLTCYYQRSENIESFMNEHTGFGTTIISIIFAFAIKQIELDKFEFIGFDIQKLISKKEKGKVFLCFNSKNI